MTDADTYPLTVAEFQEFRHLLYVATGGLVELTPPFGIAGQPIHRKPLLWTWHISRLFGTAANRATVAEQDLARKLAEWSGPSDERAIEARDKLAADLLARLEAHDAEYRARQAGGQQP